LIEIGQLDAAGLRRFKHNQVGPGGPLTAMNKQSPGGIGGALLQPLGAQGARSGSQHNGAETLRRFKPTFPLPWAGWVLDLSPVVLS
jgi:hypothetical protein